MDKKKEAAEEVPYAELVESRISTVTSAGGDSFGKLKSEVKADDDNCLDDKSMRPILAGLDRPQLTFKAIAVGLIVGTFNAVLAMYYGLRTGVTPSLNVLAGLGGFMIMQLLLKWQVVTGTFTVQENAVIQTCAVATYSLASGAGFSSGLLALTPEVYEIVGNATGNAIETRFAAQRSGHQGAGKTGRAKPCRAGDDPDDTAPCLGATCVLS